MHNRQDMRRKLKKLQEIIEFIDIHLRNFVLNFNKKNFILRLYTIAYFAFKIQRIYTIRRISARKVRVRLWHIIRIWTNRLFTANINLANNRDVIRKEISVSFTDPRSRIGVSCSTLCRVIRKLRTRADYPKKVLSSLRLDGVDRRFTSDWDGVSRTQT